MADVIQFKRKDTEDFTDYLREALDRLEAARDALIEDVVQLSLLGPWAAWSEQQPAGTLMKFGRDALRNTGDARISALCDATDALHMTLERLAPHRAAGRDQH